MLYMICNEAAHNFGSESLVSISRMIRATCHKYRTNLTLPSPRPQTSIQNPPILLCTVPLDLEHCANSWSVVNSNAPDSRLSFIPGIWCLSLKNGAGYWKYHLLSSTPLIPLDGTPYMLSSSAEIPTLSSSSCSCQAWISRWETNPPLAQTLQKSPSINGEQSYAKVSRIHWIPAVLPHCILLACEPTSRSSIWSWRWQYTIRSGMLSPENPDTTSIMRRLIFKYFGDTKRPFLHGIFAGVQVQKKVR